MANIFEKMAEKALKNKTREKAWKEGSLWGVRDEFEDLIADFSKSLEAFEESGVDDLVGCVKVLQKNNKWTWSCERRLKELIEGLKTRYEEAKNSGKLESSDVEYYEETLKKLDNLFDINEKKE